MSSACLFRSSMVTLTQPRGKNRMEVRIMKCGKLTAKLRDAVQVRFYENGKEVKRYNNIEIPDAVKELEFQDFKFDVPLNGAITFKIFFEQGILPEVWPEARQRRIRAKKDAPSIPETMPTPADDMDVQDGSETPRDVADPGKEESVAERHRNGPAGS